MKDQEDIKINLTVTIKVYDDLKFKYNTHSVFSMTLHVIKVCIVFLKYSIQMTYSMNSNN